jgi:hypothetical protein
MAQMNPTRKRIAVVIVVVGSALIGERVYSLAAADIQVDPVAAAPRLTPRNPASDVENESAPPASVSLRIDRLDARQRALSESAAAVPEPRQRGLFDNVNWQPAVAKAPPPPPPPKPAAPPFGYAYMGGLTEDGVRTAFFTQGERIIAVKVGDTVDSAYRIDQMTEKQMTLTYLPLNEIMVLALGSRR